MLCRKLPVSGRRRRCPAQQTLISETSFKTAAANVSSLQLLEGLSPNSEVRLVRLWGRPLVCRFRHPLDASCKRSSSTQMFASKPEASALAGGRAAPLAFPPISAFGLSRLTSAATKYYSRNLSGFANWCDKSVAAIQRPDFPAGRLVRCPCRRAARRCGHPPAAGPPRRATSCAGSSPGRQP